MIRVTLLSLWFLGVHSATRLFDKNGHTRFFVCLPLSSARYICRERFCVRPHVYALLLVLPLLLLRTLMYDERIAASSVVKFPLFTPERAQDLIFETHEKGCDEGCK